MRPLVLLLALTVSALLLPLSSSLHLPPPSASPCSASSATYLAFTPPIPSLSAPALFQRRAPQATSTAVPAKKPLAAMRLDSQDDLSDVQALIFDCDGTLVDSMPMWCENWIKTCEHFGIRLTEEEFYSHAGKTVEETFKILCKEQAVDVDPDAFYRKKDDLASEMIPLVREITPVCDIARQHHGKLPLAVVSSGPRKMVAKFLSQCKLETLFNVLICAEDVQRHKPHPDPFLTAARSLGIPPEKCRVYEDADAGVEAAVRAGMSVVDVRKIPGVMAVGK